MDTGKIYHEMVTAGLNHILKDNGIESIIVLAHLDTKYNIKDCINCIKEFRSNITLFKDILVISKSNITSMDDKISMMDSWIIDETELMKSIAYYRDCTNNKYKFIIYIDQKSVFVNESGICSWSSDNNLENMKFPNISDLYDYVYNIKFGIWDISSVKYWENYISNHEKNFHYPDNEEISNRFLVELPLQYKDTWIKAVNEKYHNSVEQFIGDKIILSLHRKNGINEVCEKISDILPETPPIEMYQPI